MRNDSVDTDALRGYLVEHDIRFKEGGQSFIMDCPKCGKYNKLYIRKTDGRFVCWVCAETDNFKGKPEYALVEMTGDSVEVVRNILYGDAIPQASIHLEINLRDFWAEGEDEIVVVAPLVPTRWPYDYYPIEHPWSKDGLAYLATRGIDLELAVRYGLRFCPSRRRVAFPVAQNGILYGWQDRLVVPHEWTNSETLKKIKIPKAVTSTGLKKEKVIMFADRLTGSDHCVLAEGPISAMKADLCGGNVATMGKAVSLAQVQLIRNSGVKKLYLALDPDAAKETALLVRELASEMEVYDMIPKKGDLGNMSLEEVHRLFLLAPRVNAAHVFVHLC